MGRKRTTSGNGLPPNLYRKYQTNQYYYQYKDPRTGKFHGLGYHRPTAIRQANELNAMIMAQLSSAKVQRIIDHKPKQSVLWEQALKDYWQLTEKRCAANDIADTTKRSRKACIKALAKLPNWDLTQVEIADIIKGVRDLIETYRNANKNRMAQAIRSTAIDLFKELRQQGRWLHAINPGEAVRNESVKVRRARLELDQLQQMLAYIRHSKKYDPWLEHVILLAVTTSHCNAELSQLTYTPANTGCFVADDYLYITREKVESRIKIPLDFKLDKIGYSIRDIIQLTQQDGLDTNYVIHHQTSCKVKAGSPVHPYTYSRLFAEVRDAVGIKAPEGKELPTFYELRSLCERLSSEQGIDTQTLMGHKQAKTTALYNDPRGGFIELKPK